MSPLVVYLLALLALNPGAAFLVPAGCHPEVVRERGAAEVRILCPGVPR